MIQKILLLLFFICFFAFPPISFADSNFTTSFDITYTVSPNGITHAQFSGMLENLNETIYAPSYSLKMGFSDMKNVQSFDSLGSITPIIKDDSSGKSITIPFNKKSIGIHNKQYFTFSFDTNELANHVGNIWEINVPGIANQTDFTNFIVHLKVPDTFGKQAYSKPLQVGDSLDFDKQTLGSSGISLAFGANQIYAYSLSYHVKNTNVFPVKTELALPPTTNYQEVSLSDISPKPTNVTLDQDGNWIAHYTLFPSQNLTVTAVGNVFTSLTPKSEILTDAQRKLYTNEQPFWQVSAADIQRLAHDLKTPSAIYAYVSHQLTYDFSRVAGRQQRVGAEGVLKNPTSAVCLEFTDLFIAIARAAGIPAREIDGYAYTQNTKERPLSLVKDILHTWPEYYDDKTQTWIMVDPTWENTTHGTDYFHTFDFDHVAFVVKGASSTYPVPAGGYKFSDTLDSKDVHVTFDPTALQNDPKISVTFDMPSTINSGFPITGNLLIRNAGDRLVPAQSFTVLSTKLSPFEQKITSVPIPPFGFDANRIPFTQTSFLTNTESLITIQIAGETLTKTVTVHSFFFQRQFMYIGGIILAALFSIIIFITATKSRRIPLSK